MASERRDPVAAADQDVCEKHGLPFTEHRCLVPRPDVDAASADDSPLDGHDYDGQQPEEADREHP